MGMPKYVSACNSQPIADVIEPVGKIGPVLERLASHTLAGAANCIYGIDPIAVSQVSDIRKPHRRTKIHAVQEKERGCACWATNNDMGESTTRVHFLRVKGNWPECQGGVIGVDVSRFAFGRPKARWISAHLLTRLVSWRGCPTASSSAARQIYYRPETAPW